MSASEKEIEQKAIMYLKEHRELLYDTFLKKIHLDIDLIRDFFKPLGYDGKNSDLFQKPASYGV